MVRVILTDGTRETFHQPVVVGDSLRAADAAFALDQVAEVEAVGTNEFETVFWVGAAFLGILVIAGCAADDWVC